MPDVRRFAISVAGNVADGDDLLQATVERVLTRHVPDNVDIKKWAFRICKNLWIDNYRSARVRSNAQNDIAEQYGTHHDGERDAHMKIMLSRAQSIISTLPDDQRIVMTLIAIEGYSYQEAADILETPIGTIMSRLSRARKTLSLHMPLNSMAT